MRFLRHEKTLPKRGGFGMRFFGIPITIPEIGDEDFSFWARSKNRGLGIFSRRSGIFIPGIGDIFPGLISPGIGYFRKSEDFYLQGFSPNPGDISDIPGIYIPGIGYFFRGMG